MSDTPNPRRRWLRYSLVTLLILVLLASIVAGWLAKQLQRRMRQHEAVEAILATGGGVRFDFEIDQSGNPLTEAAPPGPAWLRYWIGDDLCANVVEAEVQSDSVLECVQDLPQLKKLHLFSVKITDTGLEHVQGLTQLTVLWLDDTQVTDRGVRKLQKALPNCHIVR